MAWQVTGGQRLSVLLQFGVGEVIRRVLLLFLYRLQEVLAAVRDLLVLVVPGRLERAERVGLAGQHGARRPAARGALRMARTPEEAE